MTSLLFAGLCIIAFLCVDVLSSNCASNEYDCSGSCCTTGQVCDVNICQQPSCTASTPVTCNNFVPFSPRCIAVDGVCCPGPLFGTCSSGWNCDGTMCTKPRSLAIIIGGAAGGVAGLALTAFLVYWCCCRTPPANTNASVSMMAPPPQPYQPYPPVAQPPYLMAQPSHTMVQQPMVQAYATQPQIMVQQHHHAHHSSHCEL